MVVYEEVYYLDTSALVKRYVEEYGSEVIDNIFNDAYRGEKMISFSYWNIGEATVVFDKYERITRLNARKLLRELLREVKTLARLHRILLIGVDPPILRKSIEIVLKHHIYIADALQIISAIESRSKLFVTADKKLASIAEAEGLNTLLISPKH